MQSRSWPLVSQDAHAPGRVYLLFCQQTLVDLLTLNLEVGGQSMPLPQGDPTQGCLRTGLWWTSVEHHASLDTWTPIRDLLWGLEEARHSLYSVMVSTRWSVLNFYSFALCCGAHGFQKSFQLKLTCQSWSSYTRSVKHKEDLNGIPWLETSA